MKALRPIHTYDYADLRAVEYLQSSKSGTLFKLYKNGISVATIYDESILKQIGFTL